MLNLSPGQLSKLRNKHPIQIKHTQIGHGIKFKLPHGTVKAITDAAKKMKGVRISLDDDTININGEGLGRFMKKTGKVFKSIGKVAKPVYKVVKPFVSPLLREATAQAIDTGLSSYGYDVPDSVTKSLTNSAFDQAGLGFRGRRRLRGGAINTLSPLLPYNHPAMNPPKIEISGEQNGGMILPRVPKRRIRKGMVGIQGGSFLNAGY